MLKKTVLGVFISSLAMSANAGYEKHNWLNHYAQEKNYYCSPATIQMYSSWIYGYKKHSQTTIANSIGAKASGFLFGTRDMADALEDYTPWYGYYFSSTNTSNKDTFVKKVIAENEKNEPVVVVTRTRRTDGTFRLAGHYTIIDGFTQNTSTYKNEVSSTTGFYVNDSMWDPIANKSKFDAYKAVDPRTAFSQQEFMSEVVGKSAGKYYWVYR